MLTPLKSRVLIIGDDFTAFEDYWSYYSQALQYEVVGFVHSFWEDLTIKKFKAAYRTAITISPLRRLERLIENKKIIKCFIHSQNIEPQELMSIVHRILSTGTCSCEILPSQNFNFTACKKVITISSITKACGKTFIARYILYLMHMYGKKASIIIPFQKLPDGFNPDDEFHFSHLFHEEYTQKSEIPQNLYNAKLYDRIKRYQKCKPVRIFVTSDIQKALVSAEQCSDVIIYVSDGVKQSHIKAQTRFCVVPEHLLSKIHKCVWPGPRNFYDATHLIVMPTDNSALSEETKQHYRNLLAPQTVIFLWNTFTLDDSSFMDIFNKSVVAIGDDSTNPLLAARHLGASSCELAGSVQGINQSDAEIVMVTIPCDLTGVVPEKRIVYASTEIDDRYLELANWANKFCSMQDPALKTHFEAQADVLDSFAKASKNELKVPNNDSANRETFCRLFLQSHLPPGFRVTTGEIIDSHMNKTGQLDVVIVNDQCPTMTSSGSTVISTILADHVLGVVEVKTTLHEDSLNKALSQLRSVRALMPLHNTLETPEGKVVADPLHGKIITGIFAFNETMEIDEKAFSIIAEYPNVADFVVLPGSFAYFSLETLKVCDIKVSEHESKYGYVRFGAKGMGLAMLYGLFNSIAAKRRFSGLNCLPYIQGNWGGKVDLIHKTKQEAEQVLSKVDQFISKDAQNDAKNKYYRAKNEYFNAINHAFPNIP